MWVFFVLLSFVAAQDSASLDVNTTRKWMFAVEEILSAISLGPLKKEFTPEYLGRRTRESAIAAQTTRFRARTARAMVESVGKRVVSCIDPNMVDDAAVTTVYEELRDHGFEIVWAKADSSCPPQGRTFQSALVITILPPQETQQKEL